MHGVILIEQQPAFALELRHGFALRQDVAAKD
jgi:hypothetical protein